MKRVLAVGVALLALVSFAACGGGGDDKKASATTTTEEVPTTAAPFEPEKAKADITTLYTTFFNDQTPTDQQVQMLENGPKMKDAIEANRKSGAAAGLSAQVKTVQFQSETLADVNFDLLLKGAVVAANTKGQAKFIDGRWKVNQQLFCTLLGLGNQHPPACAEFG